jgi:hypothetical protein
MKNNSDVVYGAHQLHIPSNGRISWKPGFDSLHPNLILLESLFLFFGFHQIVSLSFKWWWVVPQM